MVVPLDDLVDVLIFIDLVVGKGEVDNGRVVLQTSIKQAQLLLHIHLVD